MKSKMNAAYNVAKSLINKYLLEFIIKKVLGSAVGGIKLMAIKFTYEILWKKVLSPLLDLGRRKVIRKTSEIKTGHKQKKVKNAKTDAEFDSAADDLP